MHSLLLKWRESKLESPSISPLDLAKAGLWQLESAFLKKFCSLEKILHLYTILYHCCKRSDLPSHQINLNPFYFPTLMESSRVLLIYIKIYLLVNLNSSILYLISSTPVIAEQPWVWALKTYKLRYTEDILQLSDESNLSFIGIWGGAFNSRLRRQTRVACWKELTASQLLGLRIFIG